MTNEEMQRKMDFIVEHQAQFAANIQRLEEQHQRLAAERLRDQPRIQELEESFKLLVRLAQIMNSRQDSTDVRPDRLDSGVKNLHENMTALAAAQTHTEERLSALIDIVRERWN
jgi:chromosome segregation ATPase